MTVAVEAQAEAFAGRMVDIVNESMLGLMISIGHQTGLFDTLADAPPLTSQELATRAGLNERYVREWLGAMATGRILGYDTATGRFSLAPEHAGALTRAAGLNNLASWMQYIALLGSVEGQIVTSFRDGGGVSYSEFHDFQRLMAEDSNNTFDATLLDVTLNLVPGLLDRLRAGIDVADIGCGSGHALNLMGEAFPASRFVGVDISAEGLAAGRREAASRSLSNLIFIDRDAADLGITEGFDFITSFDSIHDQARPDLVLAGIRQALRRDGVYLCVDTRSSSDLAGNLDHPLGPFLYTVSTMHCMTVSLALGGMGLGTVWGEKLALRMLADAGFGRVEVRTVEGDVFNNYYVAYPV